MIRFVKLFLKSPVLAVVMFGVVATSLAGLAAVAQAAWLSGQ